MPRKKKAWIDKKNAEVFTLVHRSQKDPLQADEDAPQRILLPFDEEYSKEVRAEEQKKYGIDYNDDYDYMQHLRDPTELNDGEAMEVMRVGPADLQKQPKSKNRFHLPPEVFASETEEKIGMLEKAAPMGLTAESLQYGPDVHEALDALADDFNFDDPDNKLDDDFVVKAGGEMQEGEIFNDNAERGNFDCFGVGRDYASDEADYSDVNSVGSVEPDDDDGVSCVTGASRMTSATTWRGEGLQLLDEKFDNVMHEYDDMDLGDIQQEDIAGPIAQNNKLLQNILEEHEEKQNQDTLKELIMKEQAERDYEEDSGDENEKKDFVPMVIEPKKEQWDCESIISTYSNLYNHPKQLMEPRRKKTPSSRVSESVEEVVQVPREKPDTIRSSGESLEEKKARKQAVKEERRLRRQEKKVHKTAFKNEATKQLKQLSADRTGIITL